MPVSEERDIESGQVLLPIFKEKDKTTSTKLMPMWLVIN